jgi:hypothetical protein
MLLGFLFHGFLSWSGRAVGFCDQPQRLPCNIKDPNQNINWAPLHGVVGQFTK